MRIVIAASIALCLSGCAHFQATENTGGQAILLDTRTLLDVRVEGVNAFAPAREVAVNSSGSVRVELMEQPATGQKSKMPSASCP